MLKTPSDSALNLDDFIERFGSSATPAPSKPVAASGLAAKAMRTRVLSEKRSQAIAIMMSQLPSDWTQLRSAIMQLDAAVLHPDHVQAIFANLPSKEEGDLLQSVIDAPNLDRPEHFLLQLGAIPHLRQRLGAWIFALNIDENLSLLSNNFEQIEAACLVLVGSESVRYILSIILTLGNYMNGGTARGQADGFSLDVLTSLDNSKSRDSSQTLLHYIVQVCHRAKPSVRTLRLEMGPVFTAHNAPSLQELNMKLSSLQAELDFIERDALKVSKCDAQDQFQSRIQESLLLAKRGLTKLVTARQRTVDAYNKALAYFTASAAYDLATSPALFEIFSNFFQRFHDSLPVEIKPSRESFSKIRRHALGEKIADGDMSDVIASIRKGHYLAKRKIAEARPALPLERIS